MSRRIVGVVLVLALAAMATACQKLPGRADSGAGLPSATLTRADAIPADWGDLVAVSSVNQYPDLVQLWFQDEEKNVHIVVMRVATYEILNARVVRRD